jgi:hypothetical protein
VLAFGMRVYNFSDWLVFKADQSRDAFVVKKAIDGGIGYLPLLGPKIEKVHINSDAEGDVHALRLGPLYYYQQYIVARVIGSVEPWVFALSDLLLSTLAIVFFYIFARLYFNKRISLLITTLFAFSFYVIQYSRFAWNPNQLIFWELLFVLGLFKAVNREDKKKAGRWLVVSILSYGVMSQFHTVALFGFLPVGIIFWLIYRPKVNWQYWLVGIGVVAMMYVPVVMSDIKNGGDNLNRFITVLSKERDEYPLDKRFEKTMRRHGGIVAMMLTSLRDREIKKVEKYGRNFFMGSVILMLLIIFQKKIIILLRNIRRIVKKNLKQRPSGRKMALKSIDKVDTIFKRSICKNSIFVVLVTIWILVYFIIFLKLVNDLNRARYFLVITPVIFIFVGFWFLVVEKTFSKIVARVVVGIVMVIFLSANFSAMIFWKNSLENFEKDKKTGRMPKMAYHRGFITINTMKMGLDYMVKKSKVDGRNVCYANADYQYNTGMEYLISII